MITRPLSLAAAAGIAASLVLLAPSPTWAQAPAAAPDVPIRSITLYRSGVGSFERTGMVTGNALVPLRFETEQINDILKSMVLLDLDGGKIAGVSYGSKEPLERRLKSFGVDISEAPTVAQLFMKLRGARLDVVSSLGASQGAILGVEMRSLVEGAGDRTAVVESPVVNLLTSTGVVSVPISKISSFKLSDPALNDELNRALTALAEHRADRLKTVDIRFAGEDRARRVVIAYVTEMPVWKTSYRLVLPETAAKGQESGKPTLQGWAIVENTTDSDWNGVRLSLASGRPVSFTMDLYEPIFAARPRVPVPVLGGILPRLYESAQALAGAMPQRAMKAAEMAANRTAPSELALERGAMTFRDAGDDMPASTPAGAYADYAPDAQASAGEVGEQFMYTLEAPVTLERQRSAMLPILSAGVTGRRVSIFNATDQPKHPMRGVQLRNDSGLHLMPGPIAVYDGNAYAGDAQIPHTSRNQDRLLSYALDIDVNARTESASDSRVVKLRIVGGLIEQSEKRTQTTTYTFANHDSTRARTILIEHPKMPGWDLIEPSNATESADSLYRFELPLESAKDGSMKVTLERTEFTSLAVADFDLPTLLVYAREGKASPAVTEAVKKAAELQAKVNEAKREMSKLASERDEITRDQSRIRENMSRIDTASDLHARYMKKLNEQESRLEDILSRAEDVESRRQAAERELSVYLSTLNVE